MNVTNSIYLDQLFNASLLIHQVVEDLSKATGVKSLLCRPTETRIACQILFL